MDFASILETLMGIFDVLDVMEIINQILRSVGDIVAGFLQ